MRSVFYENIMQECLGVLAAARSMHSIIPLTAPAIRRRHTQKAIEPLLGIGKRTAALLLAAGVAMVLLLHSPVSVAAGGYEIPPFRNAVLDETAAEGNSEAIVDMSHVNEGYVAMRCVSDVKIKFQVLIDDLTFTYSVVTGADQIFPLQCGSGHYIFKVMKNIEDKKYAELYKCEADVQLADPFDPFLRPSQYANYSESSECVQMARSMAEAADTQEDFINSVYTFVCDTVRYDQEKAQTVQSGYLPVPDETMNTGKGICFDYASLAASMLRSQGVPTQIIFGYVAPDDIYHAWNKFYSEENGWMLAEFTVSGPDWNRVDLTFSANGASDQFIGDGSNYMEAYTY